MHRPVSQVSNEAQSTTKTANKLDDQPTIHHKSKRPRKYMRKKKITDTKLTETTINTEQRKRSNNHEKSRSPSLNVAEEKVR